MLLMTSFRPSVCKSPLVTYSFAFFRALATSIVEVFKNRRDALCVLLKTANRFSQSPSFPLSGKVGCRTVAQFVNFFHLNLISAQSTFRYKPGTHINTDFSCRTYSEVGWIHCLDKRNKVPLRSDFTVLNRCQLLKV